MRCSSRPLQAGKIGTGHGLVRTVAIAFALAFLVASPLARASGPLVAPPVPAPIDINADASTGATVTNLGSSFLERLGNQATYGLGKAFRNNPGGGGASETTDEPRFRTWGEAYGISARNSAQGNFVG